MARTVGSPSSSFNAASSAAVICASMALRFSGRSRVTSATCPLRSVRTGTGRHLRELAEVPADDLLGGDGEPRVPAVVGQRLAPLVLRGVGLLDRVELGDGEVARP